MSEKRITWEKLSEYCRLFDRCEEDDECSPEACPINLPDCHCADLKEAYEIIKNTPELNLSNYDHEQVCELNNNVCEAYSIMKEIFKLKERKG